MNEGQGSGGSKQGANRRGGFRKPKDLEPATPCEAQPLGPSLAPPLFWLAWVVCLAFVLVLADLQFLPWSGNSR